MHLTYSLEVLGVISLVSLTLLKTTSVKTPPELASCFAPNRLNRKRKDLR